MKCKKCGKEVTEGNLFCQYCGTKVEVDDFSICSKCGTKNPSTSKFCRSCGNVLDSQNTNIKNTNAIKKEEILDQTIMYTAPLPQNNFKKSKIGIIIAGVAGAVLIICLVVFLVVPFIKDNFFSESDSRRSSRKDKNKEETSEVLNEDEVDDIFSKESDDTSSKESEDEEIINTYFELIALDNVKVREDSTTKSEQVGKIAKGSTIMAYSFEDNGDGLIWYCINYNEWVANDGSFFRVNDVEYNKNVGHLTASIGKINVTKDTPVYNAPSSSAKEIGWLTVSTKMLYYKEVEADGKTWLQISDEGYIPLDHVEYYYK